MREEMRNGSVGFVSQEDLSFLMDANVSWKPYKQQRLQQIILQVKTSF